MSKILPDNQPPSAMPTSEAMMMVPVLAPTLAAGKCSRTMMA